jgi:hypothetical protein
MTHNFVSRRFALFSIPSLIFFLFLLTGVSHAQESQGAPKSGSSPTPGSKTAPAPSKEDTKVLDSKNNKDTAVLTKELAAVDRKERPKLVEKAEVPKFSFTRELYTVQWRSKDAFDLYVIKPKGGQGAKLPVVLYLPSFPDDTDLFKNNEWCELAVQGHYAVVGFVGAVTGHRTRFRLMKEWFVSEMPEAITSTTHDVQLILDYLSTRGDLDMDHVAMYGAGSGGAIAILASVVDSRIKVLDLLAPWGDWKTWLNESKVIPDDERAKYTGPEFVASVSPLDPVNWLPKIQAKSLRIEDIRGNKAMPDKAQEKLEAAAPDFAVINQWGNGRAYLATQNPPSVLEWTKSQLAPGAKPQVALEKSERIHFFPAIQAQSPAGIQNLPAPQVAKAPTPTKEKEKEKENPQ